jgi:hypothetical protein
MVYKLLTKTDMPGTDSRMADVFFGDDQLYGWLRQGKI